MKIIMIALSLVFLSTVFAGPAPMGQVAKFDLGGEGGWDCLLSDSESHRLFVARSNRIMVIDTATGKLEGEIQGLAGAHGIALSKETGRGFASSGKSNEVFVFDLKTLQVINKISVGENPDIMAFDGINKKILSLNGKSHNISFIDPATLKVTATLDLPGKPEFAVQNSQGNFFINIEDKNTTVEIDPIKLSIKQTFKLAPCEDPSGIALDAKNNRLLVACGNKLAIIVDSLSGKVLQKFKVGDHVDGAAFDSSRGLAYFPSAEGFATVLRETEGVFASIGDIPTGPGGKTLGIDEKTGQLFIPIAKFEAVKPPQDASKPSRPQVLPGSFAVLVFGSTNKK